MLGSHTAVSDGIVELVASDKVWGLRGSGPNGKMEAQKDLQKFLFHIEVYVFV